MTITAFEMAQRFVGEIHELPGNQHHPAIQWGHLLCGLGPETPDEVPWCGAWANLVCWLRRLPRSKSAAARSWLTVGTAIELRDATPGYDVVILRRGTGTQPGPEVTSGAPGHVGFYAGRDDLAGKVFVLGGNQSNAVTVQAFPAIDVLGIRRLAAPR